jgi:hypothetical protein
MRENARTRLAALREKKPPTKAAQIRSLWPEIKAALDNGHSLKAISECLAADGLAVSVRSLSVYVGRMRNDSIANQKLTPPTKTALAGNVIPTSTSKPETVPAEANPKGSRDPLANVRARQKKRPGFDYRPELADPKELI